MKEIIKKSGLTAAQFAKKYNIPYNTVRQWTEEIRKAPEWLKNLFEEYMLKEEFLEILSDKPLIEEKEEKELIKDLQNYLVEIIHKKTNTRIYSQMITYKEYLEFEENYWYIEYIKNKKGFEINYYFLKKI